MRLNIESNTSILYRANSVQYVYRMHKAEQKTSLYIYVECIHNFNHFKLKITLYTFTVQLQIVVKTIEMKNWVTRGSTYIMNIND